MATAVVWGCLKKKMLVLEGGVELPVLRENGHTDVWSAMVKNKKKKKKLRREEVDLSVCSDAFNPTPPL